MSRIVLATGNEGKVRELSDMLSGFPFKIVSQASLNVNEAEETGLSFVENAIIKARNASSQTGLPALADDSGLAVDALNGEPGIYSARYAARANRGEGDAANNLWLLKRMENVHGDDRSAHFYCVIAMVSHADDPIPLIAQGIWHGSILTQPRGENGFGYDPLFWIAAKNCTSAELEKSEKNRLSHRARALQALRDQLSL